MNSINPKVIEAIILLLEDASDNISEAISVSTVLAEAMEHNTSVGCDHYITSTRHIANVLLNCRKYIYEAEETLTYGTVKEGNEES